MVAFHLSLITPTMSTVWRSGILPESGFARLIETTPLKLLLAGNAAVIVFFVLSGFVLTVLVMKKESFNWAAYFPQRLVRILLPTLASVAFACLVIVATNRVTDPGQSAWVQFYTYPHLDWRMIVNALNLFDGVSDLNSPLWSLRWELLFSLLLPLAALIAASGRRAAAITLAVSPLVVGLGHATSSQALIYLPDFAIGVAVATLLLGAGARRPAGRLTARAHLGWAGWVAGSLLLLCPQWVLNAMGVHEPKVFTAVLAFVPLGAAGIVTAAVRWTVASRFLESTPIAWLGRISFSLYLVHAPILLASANVLRDAPILVQLAVALIASLLAAVAFARFVEGPSHRLAKRIGASGTALAPPAAASVPFPEADAASVPPNGH